MSNPKVIELLRTMSAKQTRELMREVVDVMVERNDAEEMAAFLANKLGGDDLEVTRSHAGRAKLHDPIERAQRIGWHLVKMTEVKADGAQAPGFVTLAHTGSGPTPYVVHFFNAQDGGFHNGDYRADSEKAHDAFNARAKRMTAHH